MTDPGANPRPLTRRHFAGLAGAAAAGAGLGAGGFAVAEAAQPAPAGPALQGQVALVTGAARSIGRASARALAQQGADVAVVDIAAPDAITGIGYPLASPADLDETRRLVEAEGRRCEAVVADVRNGDQMRDVVRRVVEALGRIDVLHANAGIVPVAPFVEMSDAQWRDVVEVNLTGVANCMRAVLPHMIQRRSGRIIATTSTNGRQGTARNVHYAASKWGVVGLVKSAALEVGGSGVTVNAVAPTAVRTVRWDRLSDQQRSDASSALRQVHALPVDILEPEDVAGAVVFLASPAARYITGAVLDVAAGANARYTG